MTTVGSIMNDMRDKIEKLEAENGRLKDFRQMWIAQQDDLKNLEAENQKLREALTVISAMHIECEQRAIERAALAKEGMMDTQDFDNQLAALRIVADNETLRARVAELESRDQRFSMREPTALRAQLAAAQASIKELESLQHKWRG